MFRRKFWLSLALTVPIVATSRLVMDWLGYSLDFPGVSWVGPVLGTIVFFYGGWPFLVGGSYIASLATSLASLTWTSGGNCPRW